MAKQQQKPAGSLARFSLGAMLLALLGIALSTGLLFLQVTRGANNAHNDSAANQQARAIATLINTRYEDMRATLASHTSSDAVIAALSNANAETRTALAEQIKSTTPVAARIDLIPRGTAKVDLNASVPINFAALDLIRRAEGGSFVGPEASATPSDFIYTAAPVTDDSGLVGVMFVAYSANYLLTPLAGIDPSLGFAEVEQSVDSAPSSVVFEYGAKSDSFIGITQDLKAPSWTLSFKSANQGSVTTLMDLLLPITAALVLTLGGIWFAFNKLGTALRSDASALADMGSKLFKRQAPSADQFHINHLQQVGQVLVRAQNESSGLPAGRKTQAQAHAKDQDQAADNATTLQKAKELRKERASKDDIADGVEDELASAPAGAKAAAVAAASAAALAASKTEDAKAAVQEAEAPEPEESPITEDDFLDFSDSDDELDLSSPASSQGSFLQPDLPEVQETDLEENLKAIGPANHADIEIAPEIFRAYDIRGIVDTNLTTKVVYWIGRAFAAQARSEGQNAAVVGRDGRLSSPALSQELIRGLLDSGMDVTDIGQVATPMLYFATHTLKTGTGIMITGSHNPPEYNGLKMMIGGVTLAEERITQLHKRLVNSKVEAAETPGELKAQVIDTEYMNRILDDVAVAQSLKIVVDCGNGVAGGIAPLILQELGCEVIPLYCEVDGTFPNHHPDPADPKNLQDLIKVVKAEKADAGIAFDGDGDRIGLVTDKGEIIWPDKLMMLFARDIVGRNPGADIIYDVKCSRHLNNLIAEYGGRPIMWKTGHSHIKAKLKETGALLAGEFSGHVAFGERWYGFDDAIYTAARLLEIVGSNTDSITEVFETFPDTQSTPEIQITTTESEKFQIIDKLAASADFGEGTVTTIDGVRVDYASGWGLVRASNTSPKLTLRFEADTTDALEEVQNRFRTELAKVSATLKF